MFGVFEGTKVEFAFFFLTVSSVCFLDYYSQISIFSFLPIEKKTVEKATKSTMFLHIGFFIPLSPVYAGTELTVSFKRLPVLGSCYGFRSIFPWQMF